MERNSFQLLMIHNETRRRRRMIRHHDQQQQQQQQPPPTSMTTMLNGDDNNDTKTTISPYEIELEVGRQRQQQQQLNATATSRSLVPQQQQQHHRFEDDDDGRRTTTTPATTRQQQYHDDEGNNNNGTSILLSTTTTGSTNRNTILYNFIFMSILFSTNHGCVVACLGLATARLGNVEGAVQSSTLYIFYTGSAIMGSTYIIKRLGSLNGTMFGMALYCAYVGAFYIATLSVSAHTKLIAILLGAAIGGIGAGFIWTGQGSYFATAAEAYSVAADGDSNHNIPLSDATSKFAGIFAFIYLATEVSLRLLSTVLLAIDNSGQSWSTIFAIYSAIAIISTILMIFVRKFDNNNTNTLEGSSINSTRRSSTSSVWYKLTAAIQLLWYDGKMKYMIGLNAVFGFSGAFLDSYVNGNVVQAVLHDDKSKYVGIYTAWISFVAAACSLFFGRISQIIGKGPILIVGSICFALVALPFLLYPDVHNTYHWNWFTLLLVYTMQGAGRATFEGTLKATFADYFSYEKEGAFANIIIQNGLASAMGYILSIRLSCQPNPSNIYCVEYHDGTYHDLFKFELLIVISAIFAIVGYWRASTIHKYYHEYQRADDLLFHDNTVDDDNHVRVDYENIATADDSQE